MSLNEEYPSQYFIRVMVLRPSFFLTFLHPSQFLFERCSSLMIRDTFSDTLHHSGIFYRRKEEALPGKA